MAFNEKLFNRIFSAFVLVGMAICMTGITVWKMSTADAGKMLLLVSAIGSLMGILSTVTSANGKIWTFFFGFFDVSIYAVMCFIGGKYGNAMLHVVYFVPMQFIGWYQWRKRGGLSGSQVKARRLTGRQWLVYGTLFMIGCWVSYCILARFDRDSAEGFIKMAVLLDVIPMMCNVLGQMLMSTAYMDQWIFWIGVNVFTILMWLTSYRQTGDSYAMIYIIKYVFYLINSFNGLRIWIGLSRPEEQK